MFLEIKNWFHCILVVTALTSYLVIAWKFTVLYKDGVGMIALTLLIYSVYFIDRFIKNTGEN